MPMNYKFRNCLHVTQLPGSPQVKVVLSPLGIFFKLICAANKSNLGAF